MADTESRAHHFESGHLSCTAKAGDAHTHNTDIYSHLQTSTDTVCNDFDGALVHERLHSKHCTAKARVMVDDLIVVNTRPDALDRYGSVIPSMRLRLQRMP